MLGLTLELLPLRLGNPAGKPNIQLEALPALATLPESGGDPVPEHEPDCRGPLVAAAAVVGDQVARGLWDEHVALPESHHVRVVFRQQPHLMARLVERPVACEHEGRATRDAYLLEVVAEALEQRPGVRRLERGRAAPLAEVGRPSRAVGAQESTTRLSQGAVQIGDLLPAFDPLIRARERDPRSLRRSLAELVEEEGKPRPESLPRCGADPLYDLLGELVAQQAATVQGLPDSGAGRVDVVRVERRVNHTSRIRPRRQTLLGRALNRAPGCVPER